MSGKWLSYVSLSDDYERKARFMPGLLSILPLLTLWAAYGGAWEQWLVCVLSGIGLGAVIAVLLSHIASAFGNRLQSRLWPDWPHDAPTNRWLHPQDKEVSAQQQSLWYHAIKALTGLDIESAVKQGNAEETKAVINDAVKALRTLFWKTPEAERVRLHNADYGFARNLTGLRPVWVLLATASALSCWAGYHLYDYPLVWCLVSTCIAVAAVPTGYWILPGYVRKKDHYYAESFFGALTVLSKAQHKGAV